MFGFQGYPTPVKTNQLDRINLIKTKLLKKYKNVSYGFADHEPSNSLLRYMVPAVAVGLGFQHIEKHITLKMNRKLEDSESAFNPSEFKVFNDTLKESFSSIGFSQDKNFFSMSKQELNYRKKIRRHVVATKDLKKGTIIKHNDLALKRSSEKKPLKNIDQAIGGKLKIDLSANSALKKTFISKKS
jgi:sialic acid synthase SpsE